MTSPSVNCQDLAARGGGFRGSSKPVLFLRRGFHHETCPLRWLLSASRAVWFAGSDSSFPMRVPLSRSGVVRFLSDRSQIASQIAIRTKNVLKVGVSFGRQ